MTKKQKRFVEEYLIDLNATQAAIRAGYSPETAYSIGSEKPEKSLRITRVYRKSYGRAFKKDRDQSRTGLSWSLQRLVC